MCDWLVVYECGGWYGCDCVWCVEVYVCFVDVGDIGDVCYVYGFVYVDVVYYDVVVDVFVVVWILVVLVWMLWFVWVECELCVVGCGDVVDC